MAYSNWVSTGAGSETTYNPNWEQTVASGTGGVTSVAGTGAVSGITLTGTVTTTGSLTLGGTLSLNSGNVTSALGYTPYNATNPSGYISSITSAMISNAGGVVTSGSYANPTWIASLSSTKITGNITAYDLVGGSVSATTGIFSGTVTIKSGVPLGKMTLVPYGNPNPSNPSEGDIAWIY